MKMIVLASAAALAIALSAAALAAPPATTTQPAKPHSFSQAVKNVTKARFTTGSVQSYSADTHTLKLKTGGEFKLAPAVTGNYTAGENVTVRWTMKDGAKLADQVKIN